MDKIYIFNFYRIWLVKIIMLVVTKKQKYYLYDEASYWWNILEKEEIKVEKKIIYLLLKKKEFRNLLSYRLFRMNHRLLGVIVKLFFPPEKTLYILTADIGPRLFIQHGFSTIIGAKKIGSNCWINQQVTIGYNVDNNNAPIIGNGVRITAGAKIIGNIQIGNNALIAANAVVIKNVENNEVVGGVPAKKIGNNVNHLLYIEE